MTKVIHTGDTHLGYRQYHSPERRKDFLDAFRRVVADAVASDVDAVVHAGDLFHDRRPGLRDILGTIDALRPLADADIPFLAVVGNHEGTRHAQWLDLFETLGLAERLGPAGRRVDDVVLYGLDYVPRSKRADLDYEFEPNEGVHDVLVSHGLFEPFPHGDWDLETVLAASPVDFDCVLLGDDHKHDTVRLDGTWATYCGSTERTSASEREPRGYNLVEFDAEEAGGASGGAPSETGAGVHVRRRGLETRAFVFVDLDLDEGEGAARVRQRIREEPIEDAVVVVTIDGAGGEVTPADVERFGEEHGALLTRVNDRREVDAEADVEVTFADPDDAVRERVRELGLSGAARDIDETVRAGDVADSNVRDAVATRVRDRIDDGDLGVFEAVDADADASDADADASDADADASDADSDALDAVTASDETDSKAEAGNGAEDATTSPADGGATTVADADTTPATTEDDPSTIENDASDVDASVEDADQRGPPPETDDDGSDDSASSRPTTMEDYL